jgi:predicted anti-sigma-YlaC factor YlaD
MPDMHSDRWWARALGGELSVSETEAWEAHLERCDACRREWKAVADLDRLFTSVPDPAPPADFVERTMDRWTEVRRRRLNLGIVVGALLVVIVLAVEIVVLGSVFSDVARIASTFLASRDILIQTLMRMGVGIVTMGRRLVPYALGLAALAFFLTMPNGVLATLAVVMVRRRRKQETVEQAG